MNNASPAVTGRQTCAKGIKEALLPVFENSPVMTAYLYGSHATGTADHTSDVNLAVLVDPKSWDASRNVHQEIHADCCRALQRDDVDVVVLNGTGDLLLLNEVTHRGMVLVDENPTARVEFEGQILDEYVHCVLHREKR